MRIVPFIFNWPGYFEEACASQDALAKCFDRVMVINSDEHNTRPGWIDVGNNAYFSAQFLKAVDLFDGDILFHLQADAAYDNWPSVFERALDAYDRCNWGVFAPHVDWSAWKTPGADVVSPFADDPDLRLVACTDCTCWMIHRDIIDRFRQSSGHFRNTRYGWGIDVLVSAISYSMGRPVLRDYRHVIDHPEGRGYDTVTAREELAAFRAQVDPGVADILDCILNRKRALARYLPLLNDEDNPSR